MTYNCTEMYHPHFIGDVNQDSERLGKIQSTLISGHSLNQESNSHYISSKVFTCLSLAETEQCIF